MLQESLVGVNSGFNEAKRSLIYIHLTHPTRQMQVEKLINFKHMYNLVNLIIILHIVNDHSNICLIYLTFDVMII